MKEKITEENYVGYKKLYMHKQDLPSLITLFFLLNMLIIAGLGFMSLPLILSSVPNISSVVFGGITLITISSSVATIVYDYNKKINLLQKEYPYINGKISVKNLKEMFEEYNTYKIMESKIERCNEIKEEMLKEKDNHASLNYNKIPEEELERVKVKIKTLYRK